MAWNEQDHPRVPAGKNAGGQFTDKQISTVEHAARKAAGLMTKYFPEDSGKATNALFMERFAMNRELRSGEVEENPYDLDIEGTKKAFEWAMENNAEEIPEETVMFRGVSARSAKKYLSKKEFTDKGYTFLTTDLEMAKKYAGRKGSVLSVVVPKGQRGVWGMKDQSEFILPTNTSFVVGDDDIIRIKR